MDFTTPQLIEHIDQWLAEDIGSGDHSSLASIDANAQAQSRLLFKEDGVLAGMDLAKTVLHRVDPEIQFEPIAKDGDYITKGTLIATATGKAISLLSAERLLLNLMQRLSGIASQTKQAVDLVKGSSVKLLDTRKTTPGLRALEKWAVTVGGGHNHRFGLFDMIMLKDNHIDSAGGIVPAINKTLQYLKDKNLDLKIEVETRNLEEVKLVLETGHIHRIMLDNFNPELCVEAVKLIDGKYETEASGGINLTNLASYAHTGVDYISLGFLTHSAVAKDISMKTKLIS